MNFNGQRAYTSAVVLTPCAKNGIFRYFDGWNNAPANATTVAFGSPSTAVVDLAGNPVTPTTNPTGGPYTGKLEYLSVFGPGSFTGGGGGSPCFHIPLSPTTHHR